MTARRSLPECRYDDLRHGSLARLVARRVQVRYRRALACLSAIAGVGLAAFSAPSALAQGTPPTPAPASANAPAAAVVRDETSKPASTKPGAPVGFSDAVNHGFIGNLNAPPPPAIDRIRGVRLPGAEPVGAANAQSPALRPDTKPSGASAVSTLGGEKPGTTPPSPEPQRARADDAGAPISPAQPVSGEAATAKPAP